MGLLPAARWRLQALRDALSGKLAQQQQSAAEGGHAMEGNAGTVAWPEEPAEAAEWRRARGALAEAAFALQSNCGAEARQAAWAWREAAGRVASFSAGGEDSSGNVDAEDDLGERQLLRAAAGFASAAAAEPCTDGLALTLSAYRLQRPAAQPPSPLGKRRCPSRWRELVLAKARAAARFAGRWEALAEAAAAYDGARAAAEEAKAAAEAAAGAQERAIVAMEARCAAAGVSTAPAVAGVLFHPRQGQDRQDAGGQERDEEVVGANHNAAR